MAQDMAQDMAQEQKGLQWIEQGHTLEGFADGQLRAVVNLAPETKDTTGHVRRNPLYCASVIYTGGDFSDIQRFLSVTLAKNWCELETSGYDATEEVWSEEVSGGRVIFRNEDDSVEYGEPDWTELLKGGGVIYITGTQEDEDETEDEEPATVKTTTTGAGFTIHVPADVTTFEVSDPKTAERNRRKELLAEILTELLGIDTEENQQ